MPDETIVLPRSGVVLRPAPKPSYGWLVSDDSERIGFRNAPNGIWCAKFLGSDFSHAATSSEGCIAWLDACVLRMRAALLPADIRDRVAQALHDESQRYIRTGSFENATSAQRSLCYAQADAVLSALVPHE